MLLRILTFAFLTLGLARPALAGESRIEIEVDPIAYALGGYSFHLGPALGSWKFDFGVAATDLTQSQTALVYSNDNFKTKFESFGAKIDYIGSDQIGLHVGAQWDYAKFTYASTRNNQSAENAVQSFGLRIGYRFGRGTFYADPWIGFIQNYGGSGDVNVGGETYKQPRFQVFPTVHLGMRF